MTRPGRRATPVMDRLCAKLDSTQNDGLDCWLWLGSKTRNGYGMLLGPRGRVEPAHRLAYECFIGEIPDGLELDHLCRNRGCVNPWHLEPVTPQVNSLRGDNANRQKTHCLRGHAFDWANTYFCPRGKRECRICRSESTRRSHARKAESIGT